MNFGAFVADRDDQVVGTVERAVLDLTTNEVLEYVVHKTINVDRDVVVPMSAVSEWSIDAMVLNLSASDVENLPDYVSVIKQAGLSLQGSRIAVPSTSVEISGQTRVECVDGEIGTLQGVIVDEYTAEATDIVVRLKNDAGTATIPLPWASSLHTEVIRLQCAMRDI